VSDHLQNGSGAGAPRQADTTAQVAALRIALAHYELSGSSATLDEAFAAAASAIVVLRGSRARFAAEAGELRGLMARVPEFDRLVSAAVAVAQRSACARAAELWEWFGLASEPPGWDGGEQSTARLLVAAVCAPLDRSGAEALRRRLRRLAAPRWASLLAAQLATADELLWRRALGERYESVRRRYAPRTTWRTSELRDLFACEPATVHAARDRLVRWLADGSELQVLPAELEAAFVHARAPALVA
jgi:hypothetical protein